MSRVAIITDSTAYIPQNLVAQYNITVAPQILIWGSDTFEDGVSITPNEFYDRLKKASVMPASSQVSPATFKSLYEAQLAQGHDVLAILISSKLSGTISSAFQARDMLPNAPIEIVDTYTTAMSMGFQVLAAAKAAESGATLAECKEIAEKSKAHTGVVLTVDTLEFLHRGGRIGGASRFLGTALNIKPLLEVIDGRIEPLERVRTRGKALARLLDLVEERAAGRWPLRIACLHANVAVEAQEWLNKASSRFNPVENLLTDVSPVVGTHVGPGTIGMCYMAGM